MRVDTSKYPAAVKAVFDCFFRQDEHIRIVGGCVRDLILGETPKDWDMCTPAVPELVTMILETNGYRPFDLSNGHGTVSVIIDSECVEITTLRVDEETDGRHARVSFTTSWREDAERRDFTFNALSADERGRVFDYFGGVDDLNAPRIKFVGSADLRIQEDYLRVLRYFRFAGRYGAYMHETELEAIERNAKGLQKVSGERIWMEMKKILSAPTDQLHVVWAMRKTGVLDHIGLDMG